MTTKYLTLVFHGAGRQTLESIYHPVIAFLDSSFRRAATGILGGLFQTPLYHLRPVGVPSRRIQDFLSINDGGAKMENEVCQDVSVFLFHIFIAGRRE